MNWRLADKVSEVLLGFLKEKQVTYRLIAEDIDGKQYYIIGGDCLLEAGKVNKIHVELEKENYTPGFKNLQEMAQEKNLAILIFRIPEHNSNLFAINFVYGEHNEQKQFRFNQKHSDSFTWVKNLISFHLGI